MTGPYGRIFLDSANKDSTVFTEADITITSATVTGLNSASKATKNGGVAINFVGTGFMPSVRDWKSLDRV